MQAKEGGDWGSQAGDRAVGAVGAERDPGQHEGVALSLRTLYHIVGGLCGGERAGLWYCGAKSRISLKGFRMGTQAILSTMLCALGLATAPLLLLFLACRSFTPTSSPHAISLHCCLSVTGIAFRYPLVHSRYPIACKISGEFTRIRPHVRIVIAARNAPLV